MKIWRQPGNVRDRNFGAYITQDPHGPSHLSPPTAPEQPCPHYSRWPPSQPRSWWLHGGVRKGQRACSPAVIREDSQKLPEDTIASGQNVDARPPLSVSDAEFCSLYSGWHVPRKFLLSWKERKTDAGRKTSISAEGRSGGRQGKRGQSKSMFSCWTQKPFIAVFLCAKDLKRR